jgi:UDP-hydrolysing UDP-N-acetyl-D-glucosamine 2-epimerase
MQILSKKIAVFTGSRAEYGLLYWTMRGIQEHPSLDLQLIVSGMHLSSEFGNTVDEIYTDGFHVDEKVEMLLASTSKVGVAKSIGVGVISFADTLTRLNPDCLVILGDRFEALAIAQTATVLGIPTAHIHGGEITEGAVDDAIRHSITKMSHLHFTSAEEYRKRVIQMGEDPSRVFNVGAPGVENIRRTQLLTKSELEKTLNFDFGEAPLLVTYHPVTMQKDGGLVEYENLLVALEEKLVDHQIVVTYPNVDAQGAVFASLLEAFASKNPESIFLAKSLGRINYLSLMKISGAVVGNSSSGVIEAPAIGVPTVDIGARQNGRIRPSSVAHAESDLDSIRSALATALTDTHKQISRTTTNPFGDGTASEKIVSTIASTDFQKILQKKFFDLGTSE